MKLSGFLEHNPVTAHIDRILTCEPFEGNVFSYNAMGLGF